MTVQEIVVAGILKSDGTLELDEKPNLETEDRIALYLGTPSEKLRQAIDAYRDPIARETLTARWSATPLEGKAHRAKVKVEGQELTIELRRAT